jgi:hypothetical protein
MREPCDLWKTHITDEETQKELIEERKKYPFKFKQPEKVFACGVWLQLQKESCCDMLIFEEDGKASCLIQKLKGLDFKPPFCKDNGCKEIGGSIETPQE